MRMDQVFKFDEIAKAMFSENDKQQMREFNAIGSAFIKLDVSFSTSYNPGTRTHMFEFPFLKQGG